MGAKATRHLSDLLPCAARYPPALPRAHLAPTVQDAPESLPVHADATCELGHPDAPILPHRLYEEGCFLASVMNMGRGDCYLLAFLFVHSWR